MFILKWTELHQCKKKKYYITSKGHFLGNVGIGSEVKADLCELQHEALARTGLHLYFSFSRTDDVGLLSNLVCLTFVDAVFLTSGRG